MVYELNNGKHLSSYLSDEIFKKIPLDTCYTGMRYILIYPKKDQSVLIEISGDIPTIIKTNLEKELLLNICNKRFLKKCFRQKKFIIQPVFLNITTHCNPEWYAFEDYSMNIDSIMISSKLKKVIYETSTKLLVQRYLNIVKSFKELFPLKKTGLLILRP